MELSKLALLSHEASHSSKSLHNDSHEEGPIVPILKHPQQRRRACFVAAARALIALLAVYGLVSLSVAVSHIIRPLDRPDVYRPSTLGPTLNLCDCGTSIREALSKKCVYDSLATAWLPSYCRDDELTAEFDRSGPGLGGSWPYFADADGTIPINKSQIAALGEGEGAFWSSRDWHVAHCLFYWEKYIRMRDTGVVMEKRFDRIAHARHCRRLVLNPMPNHRLLIEVPVMMNSGIVEDG